MSNINDFEIENGVLKKYLGKGGDVVIPDGVTLIGCRAFMSTCRAITSIKIPSTVTQIGDNAFFDCIHLTEVTLPDGLKIIGDSAFSGCTSLERINVPSSVTEIGFGAFWFCAALKSISIPKSVTDIGSFAFLGCTELTEIRVSPDNTVYKDVDGALYTKSGNKLLRYPTAKKEKSYTLEAGVEKIEDFAFEDALLEHIVLPDGLKIIGNGAFKSCAALKSISIPNKVREFYAGIINGCASLEEIRYRGPEANWVNFEKHPDWDKGAGKYTVIFNCKDE